MSNVLNSGAQNANQATAPTPRVNDVPVGLPDGRNNFDMSFDNYLTARYGTILPFHFFQAFERDKVSFSSRHEVRSYTMSAPWMGSAYLHKHYFAVPMPALLRRNWQKIQVQPLKGDDVPVDANCVLQSTGSDFLSNLLGGLFANTPTIESDAQKMQVRMLQFFILEYFFSPASLVNLTGNAFYRNFGSDLNFYDKQAQTFLATLQEIFSTGVTAVFEGRGVYGYGTNLPTGTRVCSSFPEFLDLLRNDLSFTSIALLTPAKYAEFTTAYSNFIKALANAYSPTENLRFNYQYALAYQCVCAQFYTNDHVDNLYTWELYEQAAQSILMDILGEDSSMPSFLYNGVTTLYDVFSGHNVSLVLSMLNASVTNSDYLLRFQKSCIFLQYLFGIHNSLVYGDYFHSAKTTPLAAVDVNAPVTSAKVSAIDVTKSIVMQRFGNAVQKAGQRFKEYVGAVLGGSVSPDYHEPKWIVGNTFLLGANEIENTSNDQGNVVQNIRTSADNWVYETEFGMQSIVLGLFYFNTPSVYSRAIFRENMQLDRFDFFNPRLQNIGDQPVYGFELSHSSHIDDNFGYQTRNADMKQRFSISRGGFVGSLPSWAFSIDDSSDMHKLNHIDSEYIRDVPCNFDRFYSRLSGLTLANRFHMIFKFTNDCRASRNMQITPTIL